jgi:N-acetylmuramic acid 6-phosphate etherase
VTSNDVVVGISASGITPFVHGAVERANAAGARIVGVTCGRRSSLKTSADVMITLAVGPEVIAGSTRLKAGTATKIALNVLTTAAMIRTGKTYGNLMVDVRATNEKLRDRARRIVATATGLQYDAAEALLARANWNVKAAIVMKETGLPRMKALARLRSSDDSVRKALLVGRR